MKRLYVSVPLAALILGALVLPASGDGKKRRSFEAELKGTSEVTAAGGAISTTGRGSFVARLSEDGTTIRYRLRYSDLEGLFRQAHIHVGQTHTTGGISVWLCGSATLPGPPNTPQCPEAASGSVEDEFTAEDVIGPGGQGIAAGEFEELVRLMRAGVTYANIHTTLHAPGEIRGQIRED
jgi:hypothetical protein